LRISTQIGNILIYINLSKLLTMTWYFWEHNLCLNQNYVWKRRHVQWIAT